MQSTSICTTQMTRQEKGIDKKISYNEMENLSGESD